MCRSEGSAAQPQSASCRRWAELSREGVSRALGSALRGSPARILSRSRRAAACLELRAGPAQLPALDQEDARGLQLKVLDEVEVVETLDPQTGERTKEARKSKVFEHRDEPVHWVTADARLCADVLLYQVEGRLDALLLAPRQDPDLFCSRRRKGAGTCRPDSSERSRRSSDQRQATLVDIHEHEAEDEEVEEEGRVVVATVTVARQRP